LNSVIITTGQNTSPETILQAKQLAQDWKIPYMNRDDHSLQYFLAQYEALVVFTHQGPVLHTSQGSHKFHLNLAQLRIKNLQKGNSDMMLQAMQLQSGMSVLDCTLGLATDAVVASFFLGKSGLVTGLESASLLAKTTEYGLKNFISKDPAVTCALRKIKVHAENYHDYLRTLPDCAYDIVYFDPMFRHPVKKSSQLNPIRKLANNSPLTFAALSQAKRVARQRVVIKEVHNSVEFQRLNIEYTIGGKYSRIQYGIIEKQVAP